MKIFQLFVVVWVAASHCFSTYASDLTNDEVLNAISVFADDPVSERGKAKGAAVLRFAEESPDVLLTIDVSLIHWLVEEPEVKYVDTLLMAFVAGNVKSQIESGTIADDTRAGLLLLFDVYRKIQSIDQNFAVPLIEKQIGIHRDGKLDEYIEQVAEKREQPAEAPAAEPSSGQPAPPVDQSHQDAQDDAPVWVDEITDLAFPRTLGGMIFVGLQQYDQPGLGYSLRYADRPGVKFDLYVYDKGLPDIPAGHQAPLIVQEMQAAEQVIRRLEQNGDYRDVKKVYEGLYPEELGREEVGFQSSRFQLRYAPGDHVLTTDPRISETYVCGFKGHFVKVRFTYLVADAAEIERDRFMKALSNLLNSDTH